MLSQDAKPDALTSGPTRQTTESNSYHSVPPSGTQQTGTHRKYNPDDDPRCLTWSREGVARIYGVSSRHIISLEQRLLIPAPIRVGRSVKFVRSDILLWLKLGCPNREKFEAARRKGGVQ